MKNTFFLILYAYNKDICTKKSISVCANAISNVLRTAYAKQRNIRLYFYVYIRLICKFQNGP